MLRAIGTLRGFFLLLHPLIQAPSFLTRSTYVYRHPRAPVPRRNVLDGALLERFATMSVVEQREVARQMGTSSERVLDDMLAIQQTIHVL